MWLRGPPAPRAPDLGRIVSGTLRRLTVTPAGGGDGRVTSAPAGVDCGTTCAHDFDYGTSVVLTATPLAGTSSFAGWGGARRGTSPTCTVAMTDVRDVTATFELLTRHLDVILRGTGTGTVTSSPAGSR